MAKPLNTGLAASYCSDEALEEICGELECRSPPACSGLEVNPQKSQGGYIGGGRFAFGSRAGHTDWVGAGMLLLYLGRPRLGPDRRAYNARCIIPSLGDELFGLPPKSESAWPCHTGHWPATQHIYVDPVTMVDAAPVLIERWAREHISL